MGEVVVLVEEETAAATVGPLEVQAATVAAMAACSIGRGRRQQPPARLTLMKTRTARRTPSLLRTLQSHESILLLDMPMRSMGRHRSRHSETYSHPTARPLRPHLMCLGTRYLPGERVLHSEAHRTDTARGVPLRAQTPSNAGCSARLLHLHGRRQVLSQTRYRSRRSLAFDPNPTST